MCEKSNGVVIFNFFSKLNKKNNNKNIQVSIFY